MRNPNTIGSIADGSIEAPLLNGELGVLINPQNLSESYAAIEKSFFRIWNHGEILKCNLFLDEEL